MGGLVKKKKVSGIRRYQRKRKILLNMERTATRKGHNGEGCHVWKNLPEERTAMMMSFESRECVDLRIGSPRRRVANHWEWSKGTYFLLTSLSRSRLKRENNY